MFLRIPGKQENETTHKIAKENGWFWTNTKEGNLHKHKHKHKYRVCLYRPSNLFITDQNVIK